MSRKKALLNIIIYIIVEIFIMSGVLIFGVYLFGPSVIGSTMLITDLIFIGLVVLFNYKYIKRKLLEFKFKYLFYGLLGWVFYLVALVLIMAFLSSFTSAPETIPDSENQEIIEILFNYSTILPLFIAIAFTTPFVEEFTFRASIIHLFTGKKIKKSKILYVCGALASILFFSWGHIVGEFTSAENFIVYLEIIAPYVIISITLIGLFRFSNDNFFASMLLHLFNNFLATAAIIGLLMAN